MHLISRITALLLPVSFQSAVGFEYAGKTEKHASQKGDVLICYVFAKLLVLTSLDMQQCPGHGTKALLSGHISDRLDE